MKHEIQEYKGGRFYVVTDEQGRVGTVHRTDNPKRRLFVEHPLISRDHHLPSHLAHEAPWATRMDCPWAGKDAACDGSSLFDYYGFIVGDDPSDEECFRIAESMIERFREDETADDN